MNSYFSDFEPSFLLFGGLISKCPFYNKKSFLQEDFFETDLDLSKHPQQVFRIQFSLFKYQFSIFVFIWIIGELRELCAKFWSSMIKICIYHNERDSYYDILMTTMMRQNDQSNDLVI